MIKERRKNLILHYFDVHQVGDEIAFDRYFHKHKLDVHTILAKHEWQGAAYFIIQDKNYKVYLARIAVISNNVELIKIAKNSMEYEENSYIFDSWIKEAKEYRKNRLEEFYEKEYKKYDVIAIRRFPHNEDGVCFGKFISKHKHKGNYYFVMKLENGAYDVTKVVWFGFSKLKHVDLTETAKKADLFTSWIQEASKKR